MRIDEHTKTSELISEVPECQEFLYPFRAGISGNITLAELAEAENISLISLITGTERYMKRAKQNPFNYEEMRRKLVMPDAVNVAGFVNFLWQKPFINELKIKAKKSGINLNINIFPKHLKKQFQNYLAMCNSVDDLPELLIGKGFSSFMTTRFIENFVKPGYYRHVLPDEVPGEVFAGSGFYDMEHDFHPFGIEELVMVYDKTLSGKAKLPTSWADILEPGYRGMLSQMGKDRRDHFGFIMMLYLFANNGKEGIQRYAGNVKTKQHFTYTVRNMGKGYSEAAPVNIMHRFASMFIRSDAKENTIVVDTKEGNPGVCHFFLLKQSASEQAVSIAKHLYSPEIKSIIEKCGTSHITSKKLVSGDTKIRWIGWETVKNLPLPYLKEYLSEIAFNQYKN